MTKPIPSSWQNKARANTTAKLPYAYKASEDDPLVLVPDPEMVPFVEEAMDYLDAGHSLRSVCDWITKKTGRSISHQGISNIWRLHRSDKPSEHMKKLKAEARKRKPKTKEEKIKQEAQIKLRTAKRVQTVNQKKLARLEKPEEPEEVAVHSDAPPKRLYTVSDSIDHTAEPAETEIVFKPNPGPQTEFLAAVEKEVLYGGAAGGGKSYALIADPMRYFDHADFMGLILRRTNDELRELVWKTQEIYPRVFPGAKWQEKKSQWVFPSGARLWMTYLERDEDVLRYQGQSFSYVGWDELSQHPTPFAYNYMRSRLRTTDPTLPTFIRATTNPGGPGHCLTHGEVLTPDRGWVDISEMQAGDPIYSVDSSGKMFETVVDHTYKEWVDEDIVQVSARGLRMSITQDHKVAKVGGSRSQRNAPYTLVPFSDLPGQATILRSVDFEGGAVSHIDIEYSGGRKRRLEQPHRISVTDYAALVGWYISEGYRVGRDKAVGIAQSKPQGREAIANLLDRIGYKYTLTKTSFIIYCPSLYDHMSRYGDFCRQKFLPAEFKNLPKDALQAFFDAAMMGDGSASYYYTTSKQLADDFQEVAVKLGRIVYCSTRQRDTREGLSYQISTKVTKSGGTEILTGNHLYSVDTTTKRASDVRKIPYSGYVYCVGIPDTHTFIARQDGSVWVSGNTWVKKMFVDPAPANKAFPATDIDTGEVLRYPDTHKNAGKPLFYRRFIPASLYDNPYLNADGQYEANLLSLPEAQRRQLLEGDWNIASGAAFPEFRVSTHTIEPFEIPHDWRRFRSCDYGYSSHSAVHWYAIDPNFSTLYVYRELYLSKHTGRDLAKAVMDAERGEMIDYGMLDSSCWHQRGQIGPSIAEEMISAGCKWRPSDRSAGARTAGKNRLHELLKIDPQTETAGIVFFNTCRQIIADLPVIPSDPKGGDDIDPRYASDHAYDSIRYGIMSRPRARSPFADFGTHSQQNKWRPADAAFGY
jgi:hypothetical protein